MVSALGQELRLFDVGDAERMLPLVRSIVGHMMDDHAERKRLLERLRTVIDDGPTAEALRRESEVLSEKLVEAVEELGGLGVEFKGIEHGLVDFPTVRDGEIAYLCWQYGEERIAFWHPLDTGYAGRRPLEND